MLGSVQNEQVASADYFAVVVYSRFEHIGKLWWSLQYYPVDARWPGGLIQVLPAYSMPLHAWGGGSNTCNMALGLTTCRCVLTRTVVSGCPFTYTSMGHKRGSGMPASVSLLDPFPGLKGGACLGPEQSELARRQSFRACHMPALNRVTHCMLFSPNGNRMSPARQSGNMSEDNDRITARRGGCRAGVLLNASMMLLCTLPKSVSFLTQKGFPLGGKSTLDLEPIDVFSCSANCPHARAGSGKVAISSKHGLRLLY